jgi:hypothetical protein
VIAVDDAAEVEHLSELLVRECGPQLMNKVVVRLNQLYAATQSGVLCRTNMHSA